MLEADLQLKKDTSSLTSPQNPEGKEYWDKLYKKAGELFGTENITIPTITRPWIVPGEVIIRESEDSAYIYKANLKVMLEEDYLRGTKEDGRGTIIDYGFNDPRLKELNKYSTQLIKELILPRLTQEINTSKKYAQLRQVFFSLILSRWFKDKFKNKPGQYSSLIDSRNLDKLNSKESCNKEYYFNEYKKSFQQGEYNLKEQVSTPTGQVIRSYVSGGANLCFSKKAMSGYKAPKTSSSALSDDGIAAIAYGIFFTVLFSASVSTVGIINKMKEQEKVIQQEKIAKAKNIIPEQLWEDLYDLYFDGKLQVNDYLELVNIFKNTENKDNRTVIENAMKYIDKVNNPRKPEVSAVILKLKEVLQSLSPQGSSPLAPQEGASSAVVLEEEFEKVKQAFLAEFKKLNEQFLLKEENQVVYDRIKDNKKLKDMFINNGPFTTGIVKSKNFSDLIIMAKVLLGNASEESLAADILKELKEQLIAIVRPIHIRLQDELDKHIQEYVSKEPMASRLKYTLAGIGSESIFRLPLVLRYSVVLAVTEDMRKYTDKQKAQDFSAKADAWETLNSFIDTYSSSSSLTEALPQTVNPSLAPGGIDFTRINYLTRPMGSFQGLDLRLPLLSKAELEGIDINKELASVEQMVSAKIDVSSERLKRLLAAMSQKDAFNAPRETQLLPLLLRLCWLKEEKGVETTPDFRAVLLIADTGLFLEQGTS